MTGRSYEETIQVLNKGLKNAESQVSFSKTSISMRHLVFKVNFFPTHSQHKVRTETMVTFGKLCSGLGTAAASVHREVYKTVRAAMSDRVMPVREAGAFCLLSMAPYAQASTILEVYCNQ